MRIAFYKFYIFIFVAIAVFATSCRSHKNTTSVHQTSKTEAFDSKKIQTKYAELLNVENDKIGNVLLYSFIDEWYSTPYKYGGHTKKGIDCSNFATTLYNQVYKKSLSGSSSSISDLCKKISKNNLTEGDLLFFKIENDDVSHIGVYLQNDKFVHATTKKGVIIDDLNEPYYKKYFYTGGRLK